MAEQERIHKIKVYEDHLDIQLKADIAILLTHTTLPTADRRPASARNK